RPSFTLGGVGGGIAYNIDEFRDLAGRGLSMSPVHEILVEQSVLGWKEYELEVMRDRADNFVVVCSIENIDPMGIHTGDSITVAPAMTLSDKEYQRLRDMARRIISRVGVETGGSNIQFAVNPADGEVVAIEMNPRVSRSSALASKATGFPIAKIAAKLALGYTLDEIPNDITRVTPASFEPSIDYVVVKVPRWNFEKFPEADRTLTTQMKSVGEAMAIGRTFKEAFLKGLRSLELGRPAQLWPGGKEEADDVLARRLAMADERRIWRVFRALERGWSVDRLHSITRIDRWFLVQFAELNDMAAAVRAGGPKGLTPRVLRDLKQAGFSNRDIAVLSGTSEADVEAAKRQAGIGRVYKRIDTCAAEFESFTPYLYSTFAEECESAPTARPKVVILGSGPNRIGQGIEFDYCCCHAAFALREEGVETVMVNSNPETVSTDYDTSDRLYFEPLTLEDVLEIYQQEECAGAIVQFGGQTPLNLATALKANGVNIIGTSPESIELAEDRKLF
ncbi:MAG: carbamoyl-phosphate synthase large subunit, partial [Acidobacteria bacterium]